MSAAVHSLKLFQTELHPEIMSCHLVSLNTTCWVSYFCTPSTTDFPGTEDQSVLIIDLYKLRVWVLPTRLNFPPGPASCTYLGPVTYSSSGSIKIVQPSIPSCVPRGYGQFSPRGNRLTHEWYRRSHKFS